MSAEHESAPSVDDVITDESVESGADETGVDYTGAIAEQEAILHELRTERERSERERALARIKAEGKVRIPVSGLIGAGLTTVIMLLLIPMIFSEDQLVMGIDPLIEAVPRLVLMAIAVLIGLVLLERSKREPGAHESRGLLTWGCFMGWLSLAVIVLTVLLSLIIDPSPVASRIVDL